MKPYRRHDEIGLLLVIVFAFFMAFVLDQWSRGLVRP
jgi:hypothetical protein